MPLQIGLPPAPDPLPPTVPEVPSVPEVPEVPQVPAEPPEVLQIPTITWRTPRGIHVPLNTPAFEWFLLSEFAGIGAAPISIVTDEDPRGGTSIRHIQPQNRVITVPLYIEGRNFTELSERRDTLIEAFTETTEYGPGQLVVTRPDGSVRQIDAYYQSGMGDFGPGMTQCILTVSLYAPRPYWTSLRPQLIVRSYPLVTGINFLGVGFPRLTDSSASGTRTMVNVGDVKAWPKWTITGPAQSVTATNHTTGKTWTLDAVGFRSALLLGETVTITTQPVRVTGPLIGDSTSWAGAITWPEAELWSLAKGNNEIEFEILGAALGSGGVTGTSITIEYYPQYESA